MAKFTIERWRCDRCHVESERWLKPSVAHSIHISVDHGVAGGSVINWTELCVPCSDYVGGIADQLRDEAVAARSHLKETNNVDT